METTDLIDWQNDESHLLLNPRLPADQRARLERLVAESPPLPAHVWIATSGSSGSMKVTALSKQALLASAEGVNGHLGSTSSDVWCCVLPTFHVGGLGIHARAFQSGARVVTSSWSAAAFVEICRAERVTLSSLVPAQLSDLVTAGSAAPASLRAVVIGGGALPPDLHERARMLGWPLLPSYGLTECASQVATATWSSSQLQLLTHVEARLEPIDLPTGTDPSAGLLALRSRALLTGVVSEDECFVDPKHDGWYLTEDLAILEGRCLRVVGRIGDFIKIGGESVDISRLDRILSAITADAAVAAVPDARLGHVIHLFLADGASDDVVRTFSEQILPFERPRVVHRVPFIPRSALGKLRRGELGRLRNTRPTEGVVSDPTSFSPTG